MRQIGLAKNVVQPGKIRLVGVCWRVDVWDEWRRSTRAERLERCWPTDRQHLLRVQVGLLVRTSFQKCWRVRGLDVRSVVDDDIFKRVGSIGSFWTEGLEELVVVRAERGLVEVVGVRHRVLVGGLRNVVVRAVQSAQAVWRHK